MTEYLPIGAPKGQAPPTLSPGDARIEKARHAAMQLEATFLAEMLKSAGFGEQENSFSGGAGEDHFASFHRQAIAEKIAARGGIGLAEHFLKAMLETKNDT